MVLFHGKDHHAHHAKYLEIRLDDNYIVFRGQEQEASSAHLKGKLILCIGEPISMKHIKLTLTGMSRISWSIPSTTATGGSRKIWRERQLLEKTWLFREAPKGKSEMLKPDNYEFPFDIVLDGSLAESIEGLYDTWVTYRFKAEVGRKYSKDLVARKPLRIIRTLDPSALELSHAMSVENVWPNKIEYSISTPSKAVIFGTSVQIDFRLLPLLKGLKVGQISTHLMETHEFTIDPEAAPSVNNNHKSMKTIAVDDYELNEEADRQLLDEEADGYTFSRHLELPKTLSRCLQDTDVCGIKIRHKLKFNLQLHNPDGHVSELRATLPLSIFISPTLPFDDNNALIDQTPHSTVRVTSELSHQAPPLYGEHTLDQLFSSLPNSGYITPGGYLTPGVMTPGAMTPGSRSGASTPFLSHGRNLSSENLSSMDALTNISPQALHSRLSNLNRHHPPRHSSGHNSGNNSGENTPAEAGSYGSPSRTSDYFGSVNINQSHSPNSPPGLSRRNSTDEIHDPLASGSHTPMPRIHEVETLYKVPSYNTAVKTPCASYDTDLPDYMAATGISSGTGTPTGTGSASGSANGSFIAGLHPAARERAERGGAVGNIGGGGSRTRLSQFHLSGLADVLGRGDRSH